MQLTPHFSLDEMTVTNSGLPNKPNADQLSALSFLAGKLEIIRAQFGKPLSVTSAFRSAAVNRNAGGVATSQHLYGEAADIHIDGVPNDDLFKWIVASTDFDQCIAEYLRHDNPGAGWVHVSYRHLGGRKQALSRIAKNGGYLAGLHYVV